MSTVSSFTTARLALRPWRSADLEPFAALNADAAVMEYFPSVLTRRQSDALAHKIRVHFHEYGYGLWAVEELAAKQFMGFVGLQHLDTILPIAPGVEIGWRLATKFWGKGYATEAAQQVLKVAFNQFALLEIVSITTLGNTRSQAVMERLGMQRDSSTFEHPRLKPGHPLREHCVYRICREEWMERCSG